MLSRQQGPAHVVLPRTDVGLTRGTERREKEQKSTETTEDEAHREPLGFLG